MQRVSLGKADVGYGPGTAFGYSGHGGVTTAVAFSVLPRQPADGQRHNAEIGPEISRKRLTHKQLRARLFVAQRTAFCRRSPHASL